MQLGADALEGLLFWQGPDADISGLAADGEGEDTRGDPTGRSPLGSIRDEGLREDHGFLSGALQVGLDQLSTRSAL